MKITNQLNLPLAFVKMAESDYEYTPKRYSVTSLLKGYKQSILERRHHCKIEQDASDMIWLLFGTAVHHILEQHPEEDWELKEEGITWEHDGYTISGRFDLFDTKSKTVIDYKTASVWSVIYKNYDDWRKQLLIYAFILREMGFDVKHGEAVAILKDHSKSKAKYDRDYPQFPVQRVKFTFTDKDFKEIGIWLKEQIIKIKKYEQMTDNKIPPCTLEERWNDGDKFAIMKNNRKRAMRVLDSQEAADTYMAERGGDHIEIRKGIDRRCIDYCSVNTFCNYYLENVKGVQE